MSAVKFGPPRKDRLVRRWLMARDRRNLRVRLHQDEVADARRAAERRGARGVARQLGVEVEGPSHGVGGRSC